MSVSIRAVLVPGITLVTAGALGLGPMLSTPPTVTVARPDIAVPTVHIEHIALAGIGRDFYNTVSAVVQGAVTWISWGAGFVPFIGVGISDQIKLNYFGLIQPLIANTVYALADLIASPFEILTTAGSYVSNQIYVGYSWLTSQINIFGLPPFLGPWPTPPPLASAGGSSTRLGAARVARPDAAESAADLEEAAPVRVGRSEPRRAVAEGRKAAPPVVSLAVVSEQSPEIRQSAHDIRGAARAGRGATARAAVAAGASEAVARAAH